MPTIDLAKHELAFFIQIGSLLGLMSIQNYHSLIIPNNIFACDMTVPTITICI